MNARLACSVAVASLGCLLLGFNAAVIAGVTKALAGAYRLSPVELGIAVSSALWGALAGVAWAMRYGGRLGRRAPLRVLAGLCVVATAGCALAWNWQSLAVSRLIAGMALGGLSVIGALYIEEIAPEVMRGKLAGLFHFNVTLGVALAYLANYAADLGSFGAVEWRWKLAAASALACLFFLALCFIPESPAIRDQALLPGRALFTGRCRHSVRLAVSIGLFSQLAGISAVLCYLNDLLERAGLSRVVTDLQAVTIGFTGVVVALIGRNVMDRMGRKELLLAGSCGAAVCLAAVALVLHQREGERLLPFLLIMFITFFTVSQGRLIWVYVRELFPEHLATRAQSLTILVCLTAAALVSGLFPVLWSASAAVPFAFFVLVTAVQFLTVLLVYPETKVDLIGELDRNVEPGPAAAPQP